MRNYIVFLFSLFVISKAYSISEDTCDMKEICCEKNPIGSFAFSYPKKDEIPCSKNIYLYADFLYMNTFENLEYAFSVENVDLKSNSQKFKPGFRVGFNALFYKDFYFDVNWTYIRFKKDLSKDTNGEDLSGSLLPPDDFNVMYSSSSRISGDFNTLDLRFMKPYYVSKCFISSPMIGIRAAWIDQNYLVRYFIKGHKDKVNYENTYVAAGLSASYNALFKAYKYIDFYANTIFSLLFGKFDVTQKSTSFFSFLQYSLEDSHYSVNPNGQISFGLLFNKNFKKDKYLVSAKLGYEFHYWWNLNQLKRFLDLDPIAMKNFSRNDLAFNGFVFGLLVTF